MCSLFYLFNEDISSDDCNEPPLVEQIDYKISQLTVPHGKEGLLVVETDERVVETEECVVEKEERVAATTVDCDESRPIEQLANIALPAVLVDQHEATLVHVCHELPPTDQLALQATETNQLISEHKATSVNDSRVLPEAMSVEVTSTPLVEVSYQQLTGQDPLKRKTSHLSSHSDQTAIAEAEEAMRDLISCFSKDNVNTNILVNRDCPIASSMRGLLLGRQKSDGATWEELWIARLEHQVPLISVTFDDFTGKVCGVTYKPTDEVPIPVQEAVDRVAKSTEVIVQFMCPVLRTKLYNIDGSIRRSLVEHLFNLSRKTSPVLFSEISLDFDSHYRLIHNCLEYASKHRYCRNVDAIKARSAMIKEKEQVVFSSVNLNEMTKGFGTFLSSMLEQSGYLDPQSPGGVAMDAAMEAATMVNIDAIRGSPSVRSYHVTTDTRSNKPAGFNVWVIDDPVSPQYKAKLIDRLNQLSFMIGVGGKSNAYVRNASTCAEMPTPVVIGGKIVYASEPASAVEVEILSIANRIAAMQYDFVKNLVGSDYKVTFHCNLIHTVVGSLLKSMYAPHSDYGQLLCTAENCSTYQHVEDSKWLPKRDELQVVTLVISNSTLPTSTELVYTQGSSQLKTIPLNSCCIHIQGPGSQQSGIKHAARVSGSRLVDGTVWRAAITLRFSVGRVAQPETFKKLLGEMLLVREPPASWEWCGNYDTKNVIDLLTTFDPIDSDISVGDDMCDTTNNTAASTKEPSVTGKSMHGRSETSTISCYQLTGDNSDRFHQLPSVDFHLLTHSDRVSIIQCDGTLIQELSRAHATRLLFKRGYLLQVQEDDGSMVPVMHTVPKPNVDKRQNHNRVLPIPGQRFRLPGILADAGLNHGSRSHPFYSTTIGSHRVIVITNRYKNHWLSIFKRLSSLDKWEQDDYSGSLCTKDSPGTIIVYGSGGAPNLPGTYAPTAKSNSRDEPSITLPLSQSMDNRLNSELMAMTARNEVVTVYVNESKFLSHHEPRKKQTTAMRKQPTSKSKQRLCHSKTTMSGSKSHSSAITKNICASKVKTRWAKRRLPMVRETCQNPNLCRCLGAFEMYRFVLQPDSADEIRRSQNQQGHSGRSIFSRFKEMPYLRFHLRPLLDNDDVNQLATDHNATNRMKLLTIPRSCDDKVRVYVSTEWLRKMLDAEVEDIPIIRDDLIEQFIDGGGLCKFGYDLGQDRERYCANSLSKMMGIYGAERVQNDDDESNVSKTGACGDKSNLSTHEGNLPTSDRRVVEVTNQMGEDGNTMDEDNHSNHSMDANDHNNLVTPSKPEREDTSRTESIGNDNHSNHSMVANDHNNLVTPSKPERDTCRTESIGDDTIYSVRSEESDTIMDNDNHSNDTMDKNNHSYGGGEDDSCGIDNVVTPSILDRDTSPFEKGRRVYREDDEGSGSSTCDNDSTESTHQDVQDDEDDSSGESSSSNYGSTTHQVLGGETAYISYGPGWSAHVSPSKAYNTSQTKNPTNRKLRKQGTSATLADLFTAMVICQYSGASRYMCRNIVQMGTKQCAAPLYNTKTPLPNVFVFRPMPMPNRAMDGIAMCLREDAIVLGILKRSVGSSDSGYDRVSRPFLHTELLQITFSALVLRFTGRILPHSLYAKSCGSKTWTPRVSDIELYLAFMKRCMVTKDPTDSISKWLSEQHLHSVPCATKTFTYFSTFLKLVKVDLLGVILRMTTGTKTRQESVNLLSDHLRSCVVSSKSGGNFSFLAQQIIADVEEIFDFPYGPVTPKGMKWGSGSFQGYEMLRNSDHTATDFANVLSTIVRYFSQSSRKEELSILGYRRDHHNLIKNVVNGRTFNCTDAEHFLCKAWIIAKYTFPQYTASVQPLSSKPHCHPIKTGCAETFQLPYMTDIMMDIIALFEARTDRAGCVTPQFCLMAGESPTVKGIAKPLADDRKPAGRVRVIAKAAAVAHTTDDRKPAARARLIAKATAGALTTDDTRKPPACVSVLTTTKRRRCENNYREEHNSD
jgi:hypothetical protein